MRATPCREVHCYSVLCKYIHYTANLFNVTRVRTKLTKLVVAVGGGARGLAGGAMVEGMAMAISFTVNGACGPTLAPTVGTKNLSMAAGETHLSNVEVIGGGLDRKTFTPLHTNELRVRTINYYMSVWGPPAPQEIARTSSPASDVVAALGAMTGMAKSSPALTPWRPPRPARACNLGRASARRLPPRQARAR